MDRYRRVGGQLRAYLRANEPSTQQIQALLGDLLADDELLLPMRDAVARPGFAAFKSHAGSGIGTMQRQALLQELGRSYLPSVVEGIGTVLAGILDPASDQVTSEVASSNPIQDKSDPWEDTSRQNKIPWDSMGRIRIKDLAVHLGLEADRIINFLGRRGVLTTAVQTIDSATALCVLEELDCPGAELKQKESEERFGKAIGDLLDQTAQRQNQDGKRLSAAICDDTIWNPQRDPEMDRRFLEAWNLRWFNKRYRPRLEKD